MDENAKWNQAFGGGTDQQSQDQLQFLYNLAKANPQNADIANTYLNAYMQLMTPTANPYQQQGVSPTEYTAYMEGRGTLEVPDEEAALYEEWKKKNTSETPTASKSLGTPSYLKLPLIGDISTLAAMTQGPETYNEYLEQVKPYNYSLIKAFQGIGKKLFNK